MKNLFYPFIFLLCLAFGSCGESDDKDIKDKRKEALIESYSFDQCVMELFGELKDDTVKVCYALGMPLATLNRLLDHETEPSVFAIERGRETCKRVYYDEEYADSCYEANEKDIDKLINNTDNLPLNPIWEHVE